MPVTAFLTDSTLCIGCKACEVACKEWNQVPDDGFRFTGFSYDNTVGLGHSTWRHVKFIERATPSVSGGAPADAGYRSNVFRWDFSSDVCKHCERAGCLEACPTGSIVRTEFGGVFVQPDICNGCGYCIVNCPFGVIDRRPGDGRAFKCTFCYDRQKSGLQPACAKVCPTESIVFGDLEELHARGVRRVEELRARGIDDATLYDGRDSGVGGTHAMFIVRGEPEDYNLPHSPDVPTVHLKAGWQGAAVGAALMLFGTALAFLAAPKVEQRVSSGRSSCGRAVSTPRTRTRRTRVPRFRSDAGPLPG